jgi:hypothetical protein
MAASGCGDDRRYSVEDVTRAFAKEGVALRVVKMPKAKALPGYESYTGSMLTTSSGLVVIVYDHTSAARRSLAVLASAGGEDTFDRRVGNVVVTADSAPTRAVQRRIALALTRLQKE